MTKKPVQNLTIQDLEDVPIWEFSVRAATGPNDGVVRPRPDLRVHDLGVGSGAFAVRTDFMLADGTEMIGYSSPGPSPPDLGYLQPAIITPSGHVPFWFSLEAAPPSGFTLTWYAWLERSAASVFPVQFSIPVPLTAGSTSGSIDGFCGLIYEKGDFREFCLR